MTLQLDLRHYETITAIIDLGTMTAAAAALHTTQSALSHRLAEAERRLDTRLFERSGKRALRPTQAGLAVHQAASRALADLERCEALVGSSGPDVEAVVRIAVGSYDCFHWFPDVLRRATTDLPAVQIELVMVGDAPGQALADRRADLVIGLGSPTGNPQRRPIFQDELMLMTAPDHPLAERKWVATDDLADESYLTYNPTPAPGFEYDRFFRTGTTYPRLVTVVERTSAITELVAAGAGVSILSRWALEPAVSVGRIAAVRCGSDGLDITWSAFARTDEPADSPPSQVADLLEDVLGS